MKKQKMLKKKQIYLKLMIQRHKLTLLSMFLQIQSQLTKVDVN